MDDSTTAVIGKPVAAVYVDDELRIRGASAAAQSVIAVGPGDVGRPLSDALDVGADWDRLRQILEGVVRSRKPVKADFVVSGAAMACAILPCSLETGREGGFVLAFDAPRAGMGQHPERRARFLSAANHELRHPIQALGMFVDVLKGTISNDANQQTLDYMAKTITSLERTLQSFLDFSKLQAREVTTADISIDELFSTVASQFEPLATEKGLKFKIVSQPALVRSAPDLLELILQDLIRNAISYTDTGGVLLGCRRRGNQILLQVWDTGPGIAESEWERIFEPFTRGATAEGKPPGAGLGLTTVRDVAERLGHEFEFHSSLGGGTMFSLSVPYVGEDLERPCSD